jgi:hypothetical protein
MGGNGMREIKYRVFGYEHNVMYGWEHIVESGALSEYLSLGGEGDSNHSPIMQYTGLKDKNGMEIYEGDILQLNKYDRVWIQFRNGKFTTMNVFKGKYIARSDYDSNDLDRVLFGIVIGNIYENPELLEVTK